MPVHNADITAVFTEIAELLEIQGENPFRVRAYRNAARSVGELGRSVQTMIAQGEDLKDIPGIGDDLDAKIREISSSGQLEAFAVRDSGRSAGTGHRPAYVELESTVKLLPIESQSGLRGTMPIVVVRMQVLAGR
jgi:DNA polymerase/3'-5' exonuclease PolX